VTEFVDVQSPTDRTIIMTGTARQPGLLDMPISVLEKIVTSKYLDIKDRRNIALCCSALLSVVRSQWRIVQWTFDSIYFDNQPPPGLEFYTRLNTVVWASNDNDAANTVSESEWDGGEGLGSVRPPVLGGSARGDLDTWHTLNKLLMKCIARRSSGAQGEKRRTLKLLVSSRITLVLPKLLSALPNGQLAFDEIYSGCAHIDAIEYKCPCHASNPNVLEERMVRTGMIWDTTHLRGGKVSGTSYWPNLSTLRFLFRVIPGSDSVVLLDRLFLMLSPDCHPSLRELYIGELSAQGIHFFGDFRSLQLTHLTKLVLNGGIELTSDTFKSLSHLVNLHTLDMGLSYHDTHLLLNINSLGADCLPSLRCLRLDGWCISPTPIDISSSLTQLTELELKNVSGVPVPLAKTMAPMPNLKGITVSMLPWHPQWRFPGRDSRFARWVLPRIKYLFPEAEVVHVGTLGGWPRWIESMKGLSHAASIVDEYVIQQGALAGNGARSFASSNEKEEEEEEISSSKLMYLQVDAVFIIENEIMLEKCETNRMPPFERTGLLNGTWDRSLEFKFSTKTEVVTIEFHYSKRIA
jgi:hypothetical protein